MKFFEKAMELKKVSEQYYRNLSNKCMANEGVKNILNMLANDEAKHFVLFQKMSQESKIEFLDNHLEKLISDEIDLLKKKEMEFSCFINQIDLYKEALEIEKKHLNFYIEQFKHDSLNYQKIFKQIIMEENNHIDTLSTIIEMIEHPEKWVESAEFNQKDEY